MLGKDRSRRGAAELPGALGVVEWLVFNLGRGL